MESSQNLNYYFDIDTLYSWVGSSVPSNAPVADGGSMYCIPTNWGCIQIVSFISSDLPIYIRHCDKSNGVWKYGNWDQPNNSNIAVDKNAVGVSLEANTGENEFYAVTITRDDGIKGSLNFSKTGGLRYFEYRNGAWAEIWSK